MGEAFIGLTDVCQTCVIQKNLLEDKGSNLKHKWYNTQEILHYWCWYSYTDEVTVSKKQNTVLESSLPDSMMRRHKGMISVVKRKLITSCSSVFTRAPVDIIEKVINTNEFLSFYGSVFSSLTYCQLSLKSVCNLDLSLIIYDKRVTPIILVWWSL